MAGARVPSFAESDRIADEEAQNQKDRELLIRFACAAIQGAVYQLTTIQSEDIKNAWSTAQAMLDAAPKEVR